MAEELTYRPSVPPVPQSIEDTGLNRGFLSDLVLKLVYLGGELSAQRIADELCLPFINVLDQILAFLKHETFLSISGGGSFGEQSLEYHVTERGAARAREAMVRSQYVGPAPVPLDRYTEFAVRQSVSEVTVRHDQVLEAFSHLVLPRKVLDLLGPAINSGRSIFIYGEPGGGKTTIAEGIAQLLGGAIQVPHAIDVDGHIIKVFDAQYHEPIENANSPEPFTPERLVPRTDRRWVTCKRPAVSVGGELTLASLDLIYDPVVGFYEAPLQLKANGGMMLIDDFGRQQVRPVDLLNRWMVPLEKRKDYLSLHTGKKIDIPFEVLIVFSTNIAPRDLVDEAFLRRIRHKVEILSPTVEEFREIFLRVCAARNVQFNESAFEHLVGEWYTREGREMRGVHPRDLIEQVIDICKYHGVPPTMTPEHLDQACDSYFVRL